MRVLVGRDWRGGFLDYHRGPGELRIEAVAWVPLKRLDELYFVRPRSLRLLTNYVREIGPRYVLRKVRSRERERHRNDKWLSCGAGYVVEADSSSWLGESVVFLAPRHPKCVERLVVPAKLTASLDLTELPAQAHHVLMLTPPSVAGPSWDRLSGWDPASDDPLDTASVKTCLGEATAWITKTDWSGGRRLTTSVQAPPAERLSPQRPRVVDEKAVCLFGYGNYAKTVIIPALGSRLSIASVHEIDPTQMPTQKRFPWGWDSAPSPRANEHYDVLAAAGYHHTHAPLAVEALSRGADAVVEKPLAVDREQLAALLGAMRESQGRMFACFHRRYLRANEWLRKDFDLAEGRPVSYHCIVYEVPLPRQHWYQWSASGSRLISNGCHWIDHFLYLNRFAEPVECAAWEGSGVINCSVQLRNGAVFTMALTDRGADRIGMRDHVEFRVEGATARLVNGSIYSAEDGHRVIRRARAHKMESYRRMYHEIAKRILSGYPGDSTEETRVSTELVLSIDEAV